ncbi:MULTISPECIES: hypothetical protein [Streptococcus]|uniref:Phage protein n=1 Tax=Streptococcus pseudopneumoniae TaxID=257758 RepID=A0A0T8U7X9_9STRE|nr:MULTISPECIES: hypothetical protein [Streptococcus]ETE04961.1 hypothetical protein U750_08540 [Streptococcus pseudopneumoniae G42]AEL09525.1 hypothetical protein SPPN_00405 [Streptococcus pseudopneumoniae IS7493]EID29034.1 hypothetical protein HMPREF1046_0698 [Streptococcus pseudopneumoniae ATCC BAA-960 = CCUG 49455]ETD93327.1 hypothetical protein U752_06295 [Streptococcus pseudopneumoniae 1321]ETE04457.1 hypothetical protein U751_08690 [Streptococcus pseudopneumoniae 22725]
MIKVLKEFYDLKEGVLRQVGERFEATEERFAELKEHLPDYVELEKSSRSRSSKEVVSVNEEE